MKKELIINTLKELYKVNHSLRDSYSGLYFASIGDEYGYVWVRDVYYQAKPNLKNNKRAYEQTYHSLLDYYKGLNYKYDDKINELIRKPYPLNNIRFIHPRLNLDLTEVTGNWGNLQMDSFGYFFLGIAEGIKDGLNIIRDESDYEIINKLIKVLLKIKYWTIEDNGIWEEKEEIHSSSIGAILSGLLALEECDFIIPSKMIIEGRKKLNDLLPRESCTKEVDLSLLTLIYPFNIVEDGIKEIILLNIHNELERENGVIRYMGDKYYNQGGEAEWVFGFCFLFMSYIKDDRERAKEYLFKLLQLLDSKYELPELFFSKTKTPNKNKPLGWTIAMLIICMEDYLKTNTN